MALPAGRRVMLLLPCPTFVMAIAIVIDDMICRIGRVYYAIDSRMGTCQCGGTT